MIPSNEDTHIIPSLQPTYNDVRKQWLCINDDVGSFTTWSRAGDSGSIEWEVMNIFVSDISASLFALIYPSMKYTITQALVQTITSLMKTNVYRSGMDSMFISFVHGSFISWLLDMLNCISIVSLARPNFGVATLWAPCHYFNGYTDLLSTHMVPS